jgi:PAS domain S-box-containing protein
MHDWMAHSIVNRATVTGIVFVLFMTFFLALVSLPVIYQQVASAQAADARHQTLRLQEYFELRLDTVSEGLRFLALNSFVVNAFIDSSGRELYLQPLLRDFQVPFGLPGQLVVLDMNHAPIASNDYGDLSGYAGHPVARAALSTGKPRLGLEADGLTLVFAAPVFYPPVSAFVGTLLLRVPVERLFEASSRYVGANQCFLVSAGTHVLYRPPCLAGTLNMDTDAGPVHALRLALAGEPIGLLLKDYEASLAAPLGRIFLSYIFLAILCGVLAFAVFRKPVRSLTRPLVELSRVAQEIAADPKSAGVATVTGGDEVGTLGQAFNAMLGELRELQTGLEQGIAEATHELRIAKETAEESNQELACANTDLARSQTDLTAVNQRLHAQNALLEESEAHLDGVISSAQDAIISIDSQHRVVLFNPAAQKMFGHSEAAMLGQTLDALMPQQFRARHSDHIRSFVTEDANSHRMGGARQLFALRSNGIEFPIEASISRFHSNSHWQHTVILRDITQRMAAENALVQSRQDLARSNADLEQFAYAASHDLIEPLRSVASSVQLLQMRYEGQLDARADAFIAHAVSGATRMRTLIDDLLAFSRVAANANKATDISMESALAAAVANLEVAIADSHAQITHDRLPNMNALGTQITQLLQNLIANAIKFRGDKPTLVHVGARQAGGEWVFSVADQGIGIEPKYFNRIFELFKRLHTREEYGGTGIGLSLCKKIVERHGGRIWVESEAGRGATFFFVLAAVA